MLSLLKRMISMAIILCLTLTCAFAMEDEEVFFADIPVKPLITIQSPQAGQVLVEDGKLTVKAAGQNTAQIEATLSWDEVNGAQSTTRMLSYTADGVDFDYTFEIPQVTYGMTLLLTGIAPFNDEGVALEVEQEILIPSPKEEIINKMIALAYANSKDSRYKFAPAQEDHHIGICKNFVMRLFDTYAGGYRMLAYPDLKMHMPKNNLKVNCAPYDYGIEWNPETAADGSPFEIVAQFKYDNDLSKDENAQVARQMLEQVQRGDFFQMVGYYGGGNGPHSLFFIADYSPMDDMLHWTDSNMRGTRVDGVRWGYMQYDADKTADWFIECINMKKRGATLYRLRDDLFRK